MRHLHAMCGLFWPWMLRACVYILRWKWLWIFILLYLFVLNSSNSKRPQKNVVVICSVSGEMVGAYKKHDHRLSHTRFTALLQILAAIYLWLLLLFIKDYCYLCLLVFISLALHFGWLYFIEIQSRISDKNWIALPRIIFRLYICDAFFLFAKRKKGNRKRPPLHRLRRVEYFSTCKRPNVYAS